MARSKPPQSTLTPQTALPHPREASPLSRWAGALLVMAALFVIATITVWGTQGERTPLSWVLAAGGAFCWAGWFIGRRGACGAGADDFARQRSFQSANAVISTLLLGMVLVGLNYVAARRHRSFDLTANSINSLSPQTLKILDQLSAPVRLTYLWIGSGEQPDGNEGATAQSLLQSYAQASDKIKVSYLNAALDPLQARAIAPMMSGQPLLVLQMDAPQSTLKAPAASQSINVIDESNISSALSRLLHPTAPVLYFLNDHAELTPATTGAMAINGLRNSLLGQNYRLKGISLSGSVAVPDDAAALIAIAPQADLSDKETRALQNYLNTRGHLLLMLQPTNRVGPNWSAILRRLGYQMLPGIVLDPAASANPQVPRGALGDVTRHPILRGVNGDTLFPGAAPLSTLPRLSPAAFPTVRLFETSPQSRAQIGVRAAPIATGSFVLAGAGERALAKNTARVVVIANALFATDRFIAQAGNQSFALAAIGWVAGQGTLVSIPPTEPINNTLSMPPEMQRFSILWSLFVLPILLMLWGGVVWWKRRR